MKNIVRLSFVLFLVCAIVAGVLGGVYVLTKDAIDEQESIKTNKAYAAVLESDNYQELDLAALGFDAQSFPTVDRIVEAGGEGWIVVSTFSGAQGSIQMAVGVDKEFKCTGISIISHSETSGLGAVAASTSDKGVAFRAQYVGEGDDIALAKKGGNIDAISGATITSNAVTNATANSIKACESVFGK